MKKRKRKPVDTQVVVIEIDNPNYSRDHHGASGNPKYIPAVLSMRESPLLAMYHHSHSIDEAQLLAGNRFRRIWEQAGGAGIQAMDYTKEPVDGGRGAFDGLTDAKLHAAQELDAVRCHLGPQGYEIVRAVCGQCLFLKDIEPRRRLRDVLSARLKDGLTGLAEFWGLRSR